MSVIKIIYFYPVNHQRNIAELFDADISNY
jgi:hypothetical protein